MSIDAFKSELVTNADKFFPEARITIIEKRSIIVEARVDISEDVFLEIYYNTLTGKKSYALIINGGRIFGYDNYKYWHTHPLDNPSEHRPCEEPSVEEVFLKIRDILAGEQTTSEVLDIIAVYGKDITSFSHFSSLWRKQNPLL